MMGLTPETLDKLVDANELLDSFKACAMVAALRCDGTKLFRALRMYRFNPRWEAHACLGLMDDSQGDSFAMVFSNKCIFLRGIVKDVYRENRQVAERFNDGLVSLEREVPPELRAYVSRDDVTYKAMPCTFVMWRQGSEPWGCAETMYQHGALMTQVIRGLGALTSDAHDYVRWAVEYGEEKLPLPALHEVLHLRPLTASLVDSFNSERSLKDLEADALSIGYPLGAK